MRQVRVVMVGDVDAGKSTILGRMLVDLGQVTPQKLEELQSSSAKRGVPIEYSFLLDAFQLERDQAITLDISRIWLRTADRDYVFVDAPGHRELIRNLLTGASEVDAAIMVVAADEGMTLQTRRQALFLQWFGFKEVLVAVNKLDLAPEPQTAFVQRRAEIRSFLEQLGVAPVDILPVAARDGENVALGTHWGWWKGPTLLESLEALRPSITHAGGPLRLLVQDVYRRDGSRVVAGRIEAGTLRAGERIVFWPLQTDAAVTGIIRWPQRVDEARAGDAVAITLDERIFVDRGAVASYPGGGPSLGHALQATVVWLGGDPAARGESLRLRIGTRELPVTLQRIDEVIDPDSLAGRPGDLVSKGDVAVMTLASRELIAADDELDGTSIGRFVLLQGTNVVAGGRVRSVIGRPRSEGATDVIAQASSVPPAERFRRNGHTGGVFWLTGLPSSGKSTLAMGVQRMLFDRGRQAYVLDGDTLRTSLNVDLGFSEEDRAENVRRTAAVAAVLADGGFIVICALISPFADDRAKARSSYPGRFHEIYVACDLPTAERRDVKGHYKRARLGEIPRFTGVSSPYEIPEHPDLRIDTTSHSVAESAGDLMAYIEAQTRP